MPTFIKESRNGTGQGTEQDPTVRCISCLYQSGDIGVRIMLPYLLYNGPGRYFTTTKVDWRFSIHRIVTGS